MRTWLLCFAALVALGGCQRDTFSEQFAGQVETAHRADLWWTKSAIRADISVTFAGQAMVDGAMLFTTDGSKARLDQLGRGTVVFDGRRAWITPASASLEMARFHVLTWSYFLALPMKLRDPGTHLTDLGLRRIGERSYYAARLTFDPHVGDSPEDWYVLYADLQTHRLAAAAYIVTYGTTLEEARRNPHAVVFDEFRDIEGVILPTRWRFHHWSEQEGIYGEPIGETLLNNLRFVRPAPGTFQRPVDAREDPVPPTQ